jgi:hypothetical protein
MSQISNKLQDQGMTPLSTLEFWDESSTNTVHAANAVRGHTSRMWVILKQERGNGDHKMATEMTQIRNCNIYITGIPYVGRRQFISCGIPRSNRSSPGTHSLFMSVSQAAVE